MCFSKLYCLKCCLIRGSKTLVLTLHLCMVLESEENLIGLVL